MSSGSADTLARAHLAVLARASRPAGSEPERAAREYSAGVLTALGFTVKTQTFEYSSLPGRYGTPIGGAVLATGIAVAAWWGLFGDARIALVSLIGGVALTALVARAMLGDAVLDLPHLRTRGENLVAARGTEPRVWLVAHLDSKSQPVPSAARVAGVMLMLVSLAIGIASVAVQLGGGSARMGWWASLTALALGAPFVLASVVGARSDGAVDNASGVAAVLAAAALLPEDVSVGVLLPSAEELGLAGARAFARTHGAATCINCDGVDDDGSITLMYAGAPPGELLRVLGAASPEPVRVRRMPAGLLTDSVAFTDRGWPAATVSRGSWKTLRRVHTRRDSLDHLRGDGLAAVAALLARAAEALA